MAKPPPLPRAATHFSSSVTNLKTDSLPWLGFIIGFRDFALTFGGFLLSRFDRVPFAVVDVEAFDEREDANGALREGKLEHF